MLAYGKSVLLSLGLASAITAVVGAQQKQCDIDEGKPSEVARATLALQVAASSRSAADSAKQLQNAVKLLAENGDKSKNPAGRSFVLGKTLVLWMALPTSAPTMKRGTLGYSTNPEGTVDIAAAIDSAFTVVEMAMPECVGTVAPWRQQKAWVSLINAAIEQVNSDHPDSAEVLAQRSLLLYRRAPYGYMVLGNVAQKRGKIDQATQFYRQTIEVATKDTTYEDVRRQTLLNLGNMVATAAESATGDAKAAFAQQAKDAYDQLLQDHGVKGAIADAARQGLTKLALAKGDTASFKATYKEQLANPGAFDYQALMNSAVSAARAEQVADARALFKAALDKNPFHRDALYNLAIMDIRTESFSEALPLIRRLVEVDPSNGDNYRLLAFAYAGMQKKDVARAKELNARGKSIKLASQMKVVNDSIRMFNELGRAAVDSALKYNDLPDKMPLKVTFTEFTPGDDKAVIAGTITNNTDAAKPYTISIDFLDKNGNVVTSQEATIAAVAPKSSGRFNLTAPGKGITAFRYKKLEG